MEVTDSHARVKSVKQRLLTAAKNERKLNAEIIESAEKLADRASATSDQLREQHESEGPDQARDTAYQSVLLSRNIANTVLGSARDLKRRIDKIDDGGTE